MAGRLPMPAGDGRVMTLPINESRRRFFVQSGALASAPWLPNVARTKKGNEIQHE